MSDPILPNCAVTVHFDETVARFSFCCGFSSTGWQVGADGSIFPPSPHRVIQFTTAGFPDSTRFGGFQVAESPDGFPAKDIHWPPLPPHVTAISPTPYPPADNDATFDKLVFDFEDHQTHTRPRYFYRLAVTDGDGILHWDDPRIYNDGSE